MSKSSFRDLCCFGSEKSRTPSPPPQTRSSPPKQPVFEENGKQSQTTGSVPSATSVHVRQSVQGKAVNQVTPPPAAAVGQNGDKVPKTCDRTAVGSEEVQVVIKSDTETSPPTSDRRSLSNTVADTQSHQSALKLSTSRLPADFDLTSPEVVEFLLIEAREALASGNLSTAMEAQISSLVTRLEAVTNRLESVAAKNSSSGSAGSGECLHGIYVVNFCSV